MHWQLSCLDNRLLNCLLNVVFIWVLLVKYTVYNVRNDIFYQTNIT